MKATGRKNTPIQLVSGSIRGGSAALAALAQTPEPDDLMSASEAAREMARLRIVVGNLESIREEKVRELSARVAAGTYRAEPQAVAGAVLRELLGELLA